MAWSWVEYVKPDVSVTIYLIYMIPLIFLANLIIASIVYFIKKYYVPFFMLNAFLSSILLYFFFVLYSEIEFRKNNNCWNFNIDDTNYEISYGSLYNKYWAGIILGEGSYQGCDIGTVKEKNDTIYFLSNDSTQYYIYKDYLYNFKGIDKIRVKKIY